MPQKIIKHIHVVCNSLRILPRRFCFVLCVVFKIEIYYSNNLLESWITCIYQNTHTTAKSCESYVSIWSYLTKMSDCKFCLMLLVPPLPSALLRHAQLISLSDATIICRYLLSCQINRITPHLCSWQTISKHFLQDSCNHGLHRVFLNSDDINGYSMISTVTQIRGSYDIYPLISNSGIQILIWFVCPMRIAWYAGMSDDLWTIGSCRLSHLHTLLCAYVI